MKRRSPKNHSKPLRRWDVQSIHRYSRGVSAVESLVNSQDSYRLVSLKSHHNIQQDSSTKLPKLHIALYSHDTMGLGHKRRNLLIAQTLAQSPVDTSILLITGMGEASNFDIPPGVDYLALPALHKRKDGKYQSRRLDVPLSEIIALRSQTIRAALEAFNPDVFIVDNVPRGAVGELDSALEYLRNRSKTHCVLGLRDVLDDPAVVKQEWQRAANEQAICDYYDAVWIYGDPQVYDPVREYSFSPTVAAKVRYTGYFDQRQRLQFSHAQADELLASLELPPGRLALCLVGGGQDGASLAQAFAQAALPPDTNGVILTGPFMPLPVRQQLHAQAAISPRLRVLEFVTEPTQLLHHADCVVAMGGYNTTSELLSFGKRSLIVPRVTPRTEQLIRAQRLQALGLTDVLHPNDVSPQTLGEWLAGSEPQQTPRDRIDLNGLERLPYLLKEVVMSSSIATHQAS